MAYQVVYADPPWSEQSADLEGSGEDGNFDPVVLESVKGLPVDERVADDAVLFLWVPATLLPVGLSVMEAWGFRYGYLWTWHVKPEEDKGYWDRGRCEHLLVGLRGSVDTSVLHQHNLFDAMRDGEHRPEYFRWLVSRASFVMFGACSKLDLFGSYWKIRYPEYYVEDWELWEESYAGDGHGDGEL
jgi:N6-adenosine-specific RNA methylase IME4